MQVKYKPDTSKGLVNLPNDLLQHLCRVNSPVHSWLHDGKSIEKRNTTNAYIIGGKHPQIFFCCMIDQRI